MSEAEKTEEPEEVVGDTKPPEAEKSESEKPKEPEKPAPVIKDLVTEELNDEQKKTLRTEKTFSFEWTDGEGTLLHGHFTARRFTIREMGAVGVDKARLNGGAVGLDSFTDYLHEMLSFCRYALTETPPWWKPEEFYDPAPVQSVYRHVLDWHSTFR